MPNSQKVYKYYTKICAVCQDPPWKIVPQLEIIRGADHSAPPTLLLCCVFMLRPALFLQQQNEIPDRQNEQGNH